MAIRQTGKKAEIRAKVIPSLTKIVEEMQFIRDAMSPLPKNGRHKSSYLPITHGQDHVMTLRNDYVHITYTDSRGQTYEITCRREGDQK